MRDTALLAPEMFTDDTLGTRFVELSLQVGAYEVDEGITPDSLWHPSFSSTTITGEEKLSPDKIMARLNELMHQLNQTPNNQRHHVLSARVNGLITRLSYLTQPEPKAMTMRDEWKGIYGFKLIEQPEGNVPQIHAAIYDLIPTEFAQLPVHEAVTAWGNSLRVPALVADEEKLAQLVEFLVAQVRARISDLWGEEILFPGNLLKVSFPMDAPFDGYLRFFGDHATLEIGRREAAPPLLAQWVDLLTHELLHLLHAWSWVKLAGKHGWGELCIWNTFDPTLALIEGVALTGVKLLWPKDLAVNLACELYQMADVAPDESEVNAFLELQELMEKLEAVDINAFLRLDKGASWDEVDQYLIEKRLSNPAKLPMVHAFTEMLRSYVWVYPYARNVYQGWLDSYPGDSQSWAFRQLLNELLVPAEITARMRQRQRARRRYLCRF